MTTLDASTEPLHFGVAVRGALVVAGVLLFFTGLDSYAFAAYAAPPPVLWVVIFAIAAAALVIFDPYRPMHLLRSPILVWVCVYFLVTTLWAIWMRSAPEVQQELQDRYRSMVFLLAFAALFDEPRARRVGVLAVAVGVAAAALLNVAETLSLLTFAELPEKGRVAGRAAGFYINPNTSGLAIAFGFAIVVFGLPRVARVPLLLLSVIGVAATFSRGASICMGLVFLWLLWRRTLGAWSVVFATICAALLLAYAFSYLHAHELLNDDTSARLLLAKDDSGRVRLVAKAWEMFLSSPILGNGLGSTRIWDEPVRAHNMFATLAADHGVLGLVMFPALGVALVSSNRGAACFALVLMTAGFFGHELLADRYVLLLTALAAAKDSPAALKGVPMDARAGPLAERWT